MELNEKACIGNIIVREMRGNSLNPNPETDSGLPRAPFPVKFYSFGCRRRIAAYFAMQMKSKRSQIDNAMGAPSNSVFANGFQNDTRGETKVAEVY